MFTSLQFANKRIAEGTLFTYFLEPTFFLKNISNALLAFTVHTRRKKYLGYPQQFPNGILNFGSLLTGERIRMACEDHITSKADLLPPEGTYKPWGIQL